MEQNFLETVNSIKERVMACGGTYYFDTDFTIEMSDGNHFKCRYAQVRDGKLYVGLGLPYSDFEICEDNIDFIKYPNAIFNMINVPSKNNDVIEQIRGFLNCQPELPYAFDETFSVTIEGDGNKYDCLIANIDGNEDIELRLFSPYVDEFTINADELTNESLHEILERIYPPKTILVTAHTKEDAVKLVELDVMWFYKETHLKGYIEDTFPMFDWKPDDENQFVAYPEKDNEDHYILASLSDF